jgi:hypothetical protein
MSHILPVTIQDHATIKALVFNIYWPWLAALQRGMHVVQLAVWHITSLLIP